MKIVSTVELANKYEVKNITKQYLRETNNREPENTMRLLAHVMRHDLPVEKVSNVIARHISRPIRSLILRQKLRCPYCVYRFTVYSVNQTLFHKH